MEYFLYIFPPLNAGILIWVVWRMAHDRRQRPVVPHCLITQESECLLLRQPTILCDTCRAAVIQQAQEAKVGRG